MIKIDRGSIERVFDFQCFEHVVYHRMRKEKLILNLRTAACIYVFGMRAVHVIYCFITCNIEVIVKFYQNYRFISIFYLFNYK